MKFNNTRVTISGDIHLNLRSTDLVMKLWESERFLALFHLLASNDSKIIILNGDIFDKAKVTYEEVGLFFEGIGILNEANKDVYIVEGNHEVIDSSTTTFDFLPHSGFKRLKADQLKFPGVDLWVVGHPYINYIEKDLLPISFDTKNILISHYRSDIGYASSEVDNELVSDRFDDAVLSDIHYRLSPAHNIQYTSSPYGIHYTPDKDYGYCTIDIKDGDYEIEFIKLTLPSKVKLTTTKEELSDTVASLDPSNKYNLEIAGTSCTASLSSISKGEGPITKFSFSDIEVDAGELLVDTLKDSSDSSISDIIMVALDDVELSDEELENAKKLLKELL